MKIIGNNKDYWWWAAMKDGIDELVVYDARAVRVFEESDAIKRPSNYEMILRCIEVGFTSYVFKILYGDDNSAIGYELMYTVRDEGKVSGYPINTYKFSTYQPIINSERWKDYSEQMRARVKRDIYKAPTESRRAYVDENIILKNSFATGIPAEEIAGAVYEYLSWCNDHPGNVNEPDNDTKIVNAGFDKKSSFRGNEQTKKGRR